MPRTKTPEGKRVGWSVKLSEPKSAAADILRGTTTRARWLETLIDAAIAAAAPGRPSPRGRHRAVTRHEPESAEEMAAKIVARLREQEQQR